MNEYYMNVSFEKGKIDTDLVKLVQNDYNSTKINFTFDKEGTIQFKMLFPDKTTAYIDEIVNNEVVLGAGLLSQNGTYKIEICVNGVDNRLTDYATHEFIVRKELINTDDIVEPDDRVPILDNLINEVNQAKEDVEDLKDDIDIALEEVNQAIEETNNLDIDANKVDKETTVEITKKDGTTKEVKIYDGVSLQFMWQGTSLGIKTDDMQDYVFVNLQGIQGVPGPQGEPFRIKKTYPSVEAMNADFNNMNVGDYVMIASTVEVEDNAKLYTRGDYQWIFITDFSGATGIKGETGATPIIHIGTVTSGDEPSVTISGTAENPIFNFVLKTGPQGETGPQGQTGATGNGIASITKTSTSGLVDTYTITYTDGTTTTFQITNGEDGEVTQAQLDETNRAIDYYKSTLNALPKVEGEGTKLTLDDTAEAPMKMSLGANMEQASTTGKNLLNGTKSFSNYAPYLSNYAKTDKDITITTTSTNQYAGVTVNSIDIINGNTYTVSMKATYDTDGMPNFRLGKGTNNVSDIIGTGTRELKDGYYFLKRTFTADKDFKLVISLYPSNVSTNTTTHTSTFYDMQIELGDDATDFEEYTGGIASPNPDYPQDIHTISGDNEIKVGNKNLINQSEFERGDISSSDGGNISSSAYIRTKTYIKVNPNTTYYFSSLLTSETGGWSIYKYDKDKNYLNRNFRPNSFITDSNAEYIRIAIRHFSPLSTITIDDIINDKIMLEQNTSATDYVEHQEQSLPLNLGDLEYCKIGDYEDEFVYNTTDTSLELNKWYLKKNIGKVMFNGSEGFSAYTEGNTDNYYSYYRTINDIANLTNQSFRTLYSNYFGETTWNDISNKMHNTPAIALRGSNQRVYIRTSQSTVEDLQTWLSTHNTVIDYPLATPQYILLNDTLQEQLTEIYNWVLSYQDQTNISQVNNDLPFVIKVSAVRDMSNIFELIGGGE